MPFTPKKKAKKESSLNQLPHLLTQLNDGKALDLTVLAAIQADSANDDVGVDGRTAGANEKNPHADTYQSTIDKLFVDHVGQSPEVVVGNAIRVTSDDLDIEGYIFNKKQAGSYFGDERLKWFNHPQVTECKGPITDGKVWLAMFLGRTRAEELLKDARKMNGKHKDNSDIPPQDSGDVYEILVNKLLTKEVTKLSSIELMANILLYVREEAQEMSTKELLRFSAIYGLDGVMRDVLHGKYGDVAEVTVNTMLPLNDEPINGEMVIFSGWGRMYMPVYAIGAILGHENTVVAALKQLGGVFDAQFGAQRSEDGDVEELSNCHQLPSQVFYWVFMKNMPKMITCLVKNCGFQFRWINHSSTFPQMQSRIFNASEYETSPRWTDIDDEDLAWVGSRERCRLRATASYKKQMEMLDLLIPLGFPMSLFFDTEKLNGVIEREEALHKDKKLETRDQCKAFMRSMNRDERREREKVVEACRIYNYMQNSSEPDYPSEDEENEKNEMKESKTLTLAEYFCMLKSKWAQQESSQAARLTEFEALDSRWREIRRQENRRENGDDEDDYASSDSYRDSDDGSSYGEGPI